MPEIRGDFCCSIPQALEPKKNSNLSKLVFFRLLQISIFCVCSLEFRLFSEAFKIRLNITWLARGCRFFFFSFV